MISVVYPASPGRYGGLVEVVDDNYSSLDRSRANAIMLISFHLSLGNWEKRESNDKTSIVYLTMRMDLDYTPVKIIPPDSER